MTIYRHAIFGFLGLAFAAAVQSAPLNLAQRPLNTGIPPAPNLIVTIDDSGSMSDASCYSTTINYPSPMNSTGTPIVVSFTSAPSNGWNSLTGDLKDLTNTSVSGCGSQKLGTYAAGNGRTLAEERQNIANYYSFYRNRINKVKSALSRSFAPANLPNDTVRLGFQSLTRCKSFGVGCKNKSNSGDWENRLRVLNTARRDSFYDWFGGLDLPGSTPLIEAMTRVGEYYKTTGVNGPMASIPGTTEGAMLSCRRNYHIMLTDGQWNGTNQHASNDKDNTTFALPDGISYTPIAPYKKSNNNSTLGDIALNYWGTDLQTSIANDVPPLVKVPGTTSTWGTPITEYWNPQNNPATWQHMVNYMIGVDLTDTLVDDGVYPVWGGSTYATNALGLPAVMAGTRNWPNMSSFDDRTYDLWHAAVNSRGEFFSADNPVSVENAFRDIIKQILAARSASQTIGGSGPILNDGYYVYQGNYEADLSGALVKTALNPNGTTGAKAWDAGVLLRNQSPSSRVIYTHNGVAPTTFQWANLSVAQKALLDADGSGVVDSLGTKRVDWLRGDKSNEVGQTTAGAGAAAFRARGTSGLGSIVHSAPAVVGKLGAGYQDATYRAYLTANNRTRSTTIYVGANDGMLHGFKDSDGSEVLAYVPKAAFANLSKLTDQTYTSRFYVDGSPFYSDIFAGGKWRTLLVGLPGAGSRGLFMLDVSNPNQFTASNASSIALMDMNGTDDADLGHILGASPTDSQSWHSRLFGKLKNGKNVLIMGNGVNSTSEKPVLFVFVLDNLPTDGNWVLGTHYFKVPVNATSAQGSNGLSMPITVDSDADGLIDTVYAGDLKGNMWKFESDESTPAGLKVALGGTPLFAGFTAGGQPQPITSHPSIFAHPKGGMMVIYGTGLLAQETDPNNTQGQTIYGIWDKPSNTSTISTSSIVQQTITSLGSFQGMQLRGLTKTPVNYANGKLGWFVNLPSAGERVVVGGQNFGRSIFVPTVIPSSANGETCSPGSSPGFAMVFDALTGGTNDAPLLNGTGMTPAQRKARGFSITNGESRVPLARLRPPSGSNNGGGGNGAGGGVPPDEICGRPSTPLASGLALSNPNRCGRVGWTQVKE